MLLCTGRADSICIELMVPGHTKFAPDLVARHIAGRYNSSDTFNHAQLQEHIRPYATSTAYDGQLLESWKDGSSELFAAVNHIMSYRSFLMFADDEAVDLGDPVPLPSNVEKFPDPGPLYDAKIVDAAMRSLSKRSLLTKVLPAALKGEFAGIGCHGPLGGAGGAPPARLLPESVTSAYHVRLLTRRAETDSVWREQKTYMVNMSLPVVNAALSRVRPWADVSGSEKKPWGSKEKSIRDQYRLYVPEEFVPDVYDTGRAPPQCAERSQAVLATASSTPDSVIAQASTTAATATSSSAASADLPLPRFNMREYKSIVASVLLAPPFNGKLSSKRQHLEIIASKLPHDPSKNSPWKLSTVLRNSKQVVDCDERLSR